MAALSLPVIAAAGWTATRSVGLDRLPLVPTIATGEGVVDGLEDTCAVTTAADNGAVQSFAVDAATDATGT